MELITLENKDDFDAMKEKVADIAKTQKPLDITYGKVLIDHVFPVKGVGTVVLGLVQGKINAGEMYELIPVKEKAKKIVLRSIQKHDRDFKEGFEGDRVGLALKGVKADEIDRNTVLVEKDTMKISNKINVNLKVIPFFKPSQGKITPNDSTAFHIISDLGITPVKIESGDEIPPGKNGKVTLSLEKGLPHDKDGLRGIMAFFSPFEGKLRIVGYFQSI